MLVILRTFSSSEYDNAGYDYGVILIEDSDAKILSAMARMFDDGKRLATSLLSMMFEAEIECDFFPSLILEDDQGNLCEGIPKQVFDEVQDKGWAIFPDDFHAEFSPGKDAKSPETVYLLVNEIGFYWEAFPMGSDLTIETCQLPREVLSQII